jgi:hypothetical protein
MGQVVHIRQRTLFDLHQAKELLPIIRRITKNSYEETTLIRTQLEFVQDPEKKALLERKLQSAFDEWQEKIQGLGCYPKGMWLVDFDSGQGYYCWHYPETDIEFYHGYSEGFRGRVRVH